MRWPWFKKLGTIEIEKQFEARDVNSKTILDIAVSQKPEYLSLLLECSNCLGTLPDEEKIDILTIRSFGLEKSPLSVISESAEYINALFNSSAISSMDWSHQSTLIHSSQNGDLGGSMINTIKHNPEKLVAFISSKTFKMLDQAHKFSLIEETLLTEVEACLSPNDMQYNMTCVGEAILHNDS